MITINADTWTTLANRALASLGRETLVDVEEDMGSDADLVRQSLPEAVGVCAEWFDWSFLRARAVLSADMRPVDEGYQYSYTIPADAIRVQGIETGASYMILGNKICTDSDHCRITYMKTPQAPIANAPSWNAAVQHYLAFMLAKTLTGNDALVQQEYQLFEAWIAKAMAHDRSYLTKKGEKWWTEEIYG